MTDESEPAGEGTSGREAGRSTDEDGGEPEDAVPGSAEPIPRGADTDTPRRSEEAHRERAAPDERSDAEDPDERPDEPSHDEPSDEASHDVSDGAAPTERTAGIEPESIDPAELTVPERSLNPRIRIVWVAGAVLRAIVVGAVVWAADAFVVEFGPILPAGVAGLFLALGVPHALLRYRVWRYEVREDALYLERGVVTRVRTVVPFVRIQHVDTSRGPLERAIGLSTAVVYTAGSRGADVTIPGLEADRAEDLQHRLKRLAIASEGDAAV